MKQLGVACRNIKRENLIVSFMSVSPNHTFSSSSSISASSESHPTPADVSGNLGVLHLIDHGCDLVPWTEVEARLMAKKLYLLWQFPHRLDLSDLLSRSVREEVDTLPELHAFEAFFALSNTDPYQAQVDLFSILESRVRGLFDQMVHSFAHSQLRVFHVLDYGCGRGAKLCHHLAHSLVGDASLAVEITCFDPLFVCDREIESTKKCTSSTSQCATCETALRFTGDVSTLESGFFDAIICSRVLCCIPDEDSVFELLKNLRLCVSSRLAPNSAVVLLAICNCFFADQGDTPHQQRNLQPEFDITRICSFTKKVSSGSFRHERHRPLNILQRHLWHAGFRVGRFQQTNTTNICSFLPNSDYAVIELIPVGVIDHTSIIERSLNDVPSLPNMALVIKTCMMEWRSIYQRCSFGNSIGVTHYTSNAGPGAVFNERVLIIDSKMNGFLRQHEDKVSESDKCKRLVSERWIDRIEYRSFPADQSTSVFGKPLMFDELKELNTRWFGPCAALGTFTHAVNGAQIASTLLGIESCIDCEFVLQIDSDIMIGNLQSQTSSEMMSYLHKAAAIFASDPRCITLSLDICHSSDILPRDTFAPLSQDSITGNPHRVEVRGCFFHCDRLRNVLPLVTPEELWNNCGTAEVQPKVGWHRLMDSAIRSCQGVSYRYHSSDVFFVHPSNVLKASPGDYGIVIDSVEKMRIPPGQTNKVDALQAKYWFSDEVLPPRNEDYVYVVLGRNVPVSRIQRCIDSINNQNCTRPQSASSTSSSSMSISWGIIIVDDDSNPQIAAYVALICSSAFPLNNITLVQPKQRRDATYNLMLAVNIIVTNPQSVIILVDMDDCLISDRVLQIVDNAYTHDHADITVGSFLDPHKVESDKLFVSFAGDIRHTRGAGNVWKHLRTFRKYLFDRIQPEHLKPFPFLANDWAFMIPMAEMAFQPFNIKQVVYLYDPAQVLPQALEEKKFKRENDVIPAICALPSYSKRRPLIAVVGDASFSSKLNTNEVAILSRTLNELGKLLVDNGCIIICGGLGGAMKSVCEGAHMSANYFQGCTVGLLPGIDRNDANPHVDVPIATGMNAGRNAILATTADAVIICGGGAGSLSEIAMAWGYQRLVIALSESGGTAAEYAGERMDCRIRYENIPEDRVFAASTPAAAIEILLCNLNRYVKRNSISTKKL